MSRERLGDDAFEVAGPAPSCPRPVIDATEYTLGRLQAKRMAQRSRRNTSLAIAAAVAAAVAALTFDVLALHEGWDTVVHLMTGLLVLSVLGLGHDAWAFHRKLQGTEDQMRSLGA